MAQETAGTIGIPVLKNEILPALDTYAKRQERYERLKAAREQKAAELAAKKAAEDAKFVPKFESGKGGYFSHILEANQSKRINDALLIYSDPSTPTQKKMLVANEANRLNSEEKTFAKDNDDRLRQAAEDLSKNKFRKVDEGVITNWAKGQSTFQTPEKFVMDVKSNPDFIDFDAIGKTAKDYKASDYTYRDRSGNTKTVKMSPLFEYKFEKDPIIGAEVPIVTGVNGIEAQKLIESNPDIKDAYEVWTKNRAKQYQNDRTFYDPVTGSPMMIRPELAEGQAAKEFVEQTFGKYGTIKYGQQFTMPRKGGAGGGGRAPGAAVTATGPSSIVVSTYKTVKKDGKYPVFSTQQVKIGSDSDPTYTFKKEYTLDKNKSVVLLQPYNKSNANILEYNPVNGRYTLKQNIKFSNATKRIVNTLDEDYISQKGTPNEQLIKAGTPISDDFYDALIEGSYKNNRRPVMSKSSGYQIAGTVYDKYNNPIKSVSIFVPESQAGEIKNAIQLGEVEETNENPWDK